MPKNDSTEAETYRRMFLKQADEIAELKKQIAQEVKEKYAAYRRIAELTGSTAETVKEGIKCL
jgi:predicted transport protein